MKKTVSIVSRICSLLFVGFFVLVMTSCTGLIQKTGSVSFEIGPELLNAAREGGTPVTEDNREFVRIVVALEGNRYGIKQTVDIPFETYLNSMHSDRRFEATFDNIPVGKKLYAVIKTYQMMPGNTLPLELRDPELYGKSDYFTVKAGQNKVSMNAANYRKQVPFAYNDTPVVTYNYLNEAYEFMIDGYSISANSNNYCFDNNGYFYTLNSQSASSVSNYNVRTTNPTIQADITLNSSQYQHNLMIDSVNNILYSYYVWEGKIVIYDYPTFISNGTVGNTDNPWTLILGSILIGDNTASPCPVICAIHDGTVYIIAKDSNFGFYFYTYTLGDDHDVDISGGIHLDIPDATITDMIYLDGSVYFLIQEQKNLFDVNNANCSDPGFGYYSRGALVKCNVTDGSIKTIGWTNSALNNSGKYTYAKDNSGSIIYEDQVFTQRFKVPADKCVGLTSGHLPVSFPVFFVPSGENDTNHFFGPRKFIAIKPKKLVIADEGVAFYTDENDAYCTKKVTRIVTVDLENFSMSCADTDATFDNSSIADLKSSGFSDKNTFVSKGIMDGEKQYYTERGPFTGGEIMLYVPNNN